MTRKHFKAMAEQIRSQLEFAKSGPNTATKDALIESLKRTAETFARVAAQTNPRFDRQRFFSACGL